MMCVVIPSSACLVLFWPLTLPTSMPNESDNKEEVQHSPVNTLQHAPSKLLMLIWVGSLGGGGNLERQVNCHIP